MTDLIALHDQSRVWIYQADSFFEEDDIPKVQSLISDFVNHWVSHNNALKGYGNLFHKRFLCLFVDETQAPASGCSIDSSVHFINAIGEKWQKNMMDRGTFHYIQNNEIKEISMNELSSIYQNGEVQDDTLFFDHLVKTKEDFINSWLKPLQDSWHYRFI